MKIVEYIRPKTIEEAVRQLQRDDLNVLPMGGGIWINLKEGGPVGVVDLQDLDLRTIVQKGKTVDIGAGISLQDVSTNPIIPEPIRSAITIEHSYNTRHQGTLAGAVVTMTGRSLLGSILLALDAKLMINPDDELLPIGDFLPLRPNNLQHRLITRVSIPTNVRAAFDYVARTTHDLPILIAAAARWQSGRTRVVIGGYGNAPLLVMDGTDDAGAQAAAADGYHEAEDEWASAEYRRETISTLVGRCLEEAAS